MTLGEARQYLSRSVENGMCPDDARVTDRINEAVERLHALGNWIGTVARFGVTVNAADSSFQVPEQLQGLIRAAALLPTSPHSPAGELICDDADAFVLESAPVLSLQQVAPGKFRIVGPFVPEAVDVMGRYRLVRAVNDSDLLAVTDIPALKLMLLALFREENNFMDMAQALIAQAVGHLTAKTEAAASAARKALFTSMAGGVSVGTLGYARAKLGLALTDGLRSDDHKLIELAGEAERRLLQQGREWRSYLFKVTSGILALPHEVESILRVTVDNCPVRIHAHWFEFSENGWGYRESSQGVQCVHRGEHALRMLMPETGKLTVFTEGLEVNLRVRIDGVASDGTPVSETLTFNGSEIKETVNTYADVKSIKKDLGVGNVSVLLGGHEVAFMSASETSSTCTWYMIPSLDGEEKIVRVIARPRWVAKLRDTDLLQVDNIPAITNMAMSIIAERERNKEDMEAYEVRALRYYEAQFLGRESGHARRVEVRRHNFAGGGIKSIR